MSRFTRRIVALAAVAGLLQACAGTPVRLGSPAPPVVPKGQVRELSAKACGFQLLLFFPISVNTRQDRAYREIERQAGGDFITDVRVSESWFYGFVGTGYCTAFQAKAIRAGT